MAKRQRADFNWARLKWLALLVFSGLLIWMLAPWAQCTFTKADEAGLTDVTGDPETSAFYGRQDTSDVSTSDLARADNAKGFLAEFFGSAKACWGVHPVEWAEADWRPKAAAGALALFILAMMLERVQLRASARRTSRRGATQDMDAPRKSGRERAPNRSTSGASPAITRRNDRVSRNTAAVSGSHRAMSRQTGGHDVLSALDAELGSSDFVAGGRGHTGPNATASRSDSGGFDSLGWDGGFDDDDDLDALLGLSSDSGSQPGVGSGNRPSVDSDPLGGPTLGASQAPVARPSRPTTELTGPTKIHRIKVASQMRMGEGLKVGVSVQSPGPAIAERARINVHVMAGDEIEPLFSEPRPLTAFDLDRDAVGREHRNRLMVPWDHFKRPIARFMQRGITEFRVRVAVSYDSDEFIETLPLRDGMHLKFRRPDGQPLGPVLLRIRAASGRTMRTGLSDPASGALSLPKMKPGRYLISLENGAPLSEPGGPAVKELAVSTDGLSGASGPREFIVYAPVVMYVSPSAQAGNGSREAPFPDIIDAISVGLEYRRQNLSADHPVEVRVMPGPMQPAERPGIVGAGASSQWFKWWSGDSADTRQHWTQPSPPQLDPRLAQNGISDDIVMDQVDGVTIVNAAYADLRDRAASDPQISRRLEIEYGKLPMAVFLPAPQGMGEAFRITLINCRNIELTGLHILGRPGQSGVCISTSKNVRLYRCWIEGCVQGPADIEGVYAVGRGVQIEDSGNAEHPIDIHTCDIGYNNVARPSLPVSGAAIALYDSYARVSRCFLHDNVSSQRPADVVIKGGGRERLTNGGANHRANNQVVQS